MKLSDQESKDVMRRLKKLGKSSAQEFDAHNYNTSSCIETVIGQNMYFGVWACDHDFYLHQDSDREEISFFELNVNEVPGDGDMIEHGFRREKEIERYYRYTYAEILELYISLTQRFAVQNSGDVSA